MNQDDLPQQKNTILFAQLLLTLHQAAMQYMGKLVDPQSGLSEANLDQAKITIDTLDMLRAKCQGNLSPDEERFINQLVSDLKLNFIDETARKSPGLVSK